MPYYLFIGVTVIQTIVNQNTRHAYRADTLLLFSPICLWKSIPT